MYQTACVFKKLNVFKAVLTSFLQRRVKFTIYVDLKLIR